MIDCRQSTEELALHIAAGADINADITWYGSRALHVAAENGCLEVVQYLCTLPNIHLNAVAYDGYTVLHLATREGLLEVVKHLCAQPNIDFYLKDGRGRIPLGLARAFLDGRIVTALENADTCHQLHSLTEKYYQHLESELKKSKLISVHIVITDGFAIQRIY